MTEPAEDVSWDELCTMAKDVASRGGQFWAKFTCVNCGTRQTFPDTNTIFAYGKCEECGHVTSLKLKGGGMMVLFKMGKE